MRDAVDARSKARQENLLTDVHLDWYTSQRHRCVITKERNTRKNAARSLARQQMLLALRANQDEDGEELLGEEEEPPSEAKRANREEEEGDELPSEAEEPPSEEEHSNEEEEDDRGPPCCRHKCCDSYNTAVVATIRMFISRLAPSDQRQFMGNRVRQPAIVNNLPVPRRKRSLCSLETADTITSQQAAWVSNQSFPSVKSIISGLITAKRRVCVAFFVWVLGVSRNKLYQPSMDQVGTGLRVSPVKRLYERLAPKRALIKGALLYMAEHESVIMPTTGDRILEHPTKKRSVAYALALISRDGVPPPSASYVRRTWLACPVLKETVKTRRVVPFSTCDVCYSLDLKLDNTTDMRTKIRLFEEKRLHKARVNDERAEYYKRAAQAILFPAEYMSVIIDGADQKKNALPHSYREPKEASNLWKQPVHNMGAISHGRQAFCFLANDSMQMGSNATIEVLHRVCMITLEQEGCLPPHLFLQLDNTTRQCKSQYVKGYCATLVACKVFEKITITYLPVGHTHEDIDQMFSVFSNKLRVANVFTRRELAALLRTALVAPRLINTPHKFKHPIHVEMLNEIANYRDFASESLHIPTGISVWYQFRIYMIDGEVAVQCRKDTIAGEWGGICNDEMKDSLFTRPFKPGMVVYITPDVVMPPALRAEFKLGSKGEVNDKIAHYLKALETFTRVHMHGLGTYASYVHVDLQADPRSSTRSAKRDQCYGVP